MTEKIAGECSRKHGPHPGASQEAEPGGLVQEFR
jgi:hypothetical protein